MTNLSRTIATTAAAVAIAAGLVAGVATPAMAAPFPPITPVTPGPSVPPLPPGDYRPAVQFPTCSGVFSQQVRADILPRYANVLNMAGQYGTRVSALVPYVTAAARTQTCTFVRGTDRVYVTETAIGSSTYTSLKTWYDAHALGRIAGGGPTTPGYAIDTTYWLDTPSAEQATISPDGWWITMRIVGFDARGSAGYDLVDQFLARNPLRR